MGEASNPRDTDWVDPPAQGGPTIPDNPSLPNRSLGLRPPAGGAGPSFLLVGRCPTPASSRPTVNKGIESLILGMRLRFVPEGAHLEGAAGPIGSDCCAG